jgi:hypothetical protein
MLTQITVRMLCLNIGIQFYILFFIVYRRRYLAEQQRNTQKLLTLTLFKRSSKCLGLRNRLSTTTYSVTKKISKNELQKKKKNRAHWAHLYKDVFLCICTSIKLEYLIPAVWIVSLEPEAQAETCVGTIKWSADVKVTLCALCWSYYRVIRVGYLTSCIPR